MTVLARVLLAALLLVVAARGAVAALLAAVEFPRRAAVYFTEPQMVHLAQRVQRGEELYPDWRTFPHVVNVFTPGYFWAVGLAGRATGGGVEGLQRLGRAATLLASVGAALLAGWAVRERGRAAMIAAAGVVFGSGVMTGFGWMTRPDVTADALGFAGFLAATSSVPVGLGVALLTAGALCKQTAVLYAAAAAGALWWQGRSRRALTALFGTAVGALTILGLAFAAGERRVFADVLLEASSPWRLDHWRVIAAKLVREAGDGLVLSALGSLHWLSSLKSGSPTEHADARRWLSLAAAGVVGGLGSAKFGSDLNYFLPLRFVAAAAVAAVVAECGRRPARGRAVLAAALAAGVLISWARPWAAALVRSPAADPVQARKFGLYESELDGIVLLAKAQRVLTNCDDAALRIGNPFVDAFVFKMLVDTGRLTPTVLRERLERRKYDWVVTTAAVDDPNYVASAFGMPQPLAAAIQEHYELASKRVLYYYRPRKGSGIKFLRRDGLSSVDVSAREACEWGTTGREN